MKILLFANTDWFMYNFNRSLALTLKKMGYEVLLVTPPGPYGQKLSDLGLRWIPAPMQRNSLNLLRELALLWWLIRLFRKEQISLVHNFTIKCAIYGSLAARLAGVRSRINAVTGMGYVFTNEDLKARLLRPVLRVLMRFALDGKAARLVLLNQDDLSFFIDSKIVSADLIRMLPGAGIDCRRYVPRAGSLSTTEFRVLLAARVLWDKGVGEFVSAAQQLRAQGRNIQFLLAGNPDPGNPAAVNESVIREWAREGWIQWLGHVEDMPALYGTVDVVVLPSYREGLPTGLTEAGACGLPLVTTDVPGCREVVINEIDGLLVPVRDSVALAAAIARLHDDPALCTRLGDAARQKALSEFDEPIVIERTLAIYRELMKKKIIISANTTWNLLNFRAGLIEALCDAGYEVVAVAPRDTYPDSLLNFGCRYASISLDNKGTNPIRDIRAFIEYLRIFWRERPQAVLLYTVKPNIYASLAARVLNVPVINNISGLGAVFISGGILSVIVSFMYKTALAKSSKVFFQNPDDESLFVGEKLVSKPQVDRLPGSGINIQKFLPVPLPAGEILRFLLVSRMLWDKGVGEFVEAARLLKMCGVNAEFCLLGFLDVQNPTAISDSQMNTWVAEGVVRYLGVSNNVHQELQLADCVVLPSYREGTPRSLLEAAAMGRPIVTTDAVGCREVVDDGVNGYLCNPKDAADLAEKMKMIAGLLPEERTAMGLRGRAKVEREFDEQIVIEKYLGAVGAALAAGVKTRKP